MDLDEGDIFEGIRYPDDDSGSAYEELYGYESLSHDEDVQNVEDQVTPKPKAARVRSRSIARGATTLSKDHSSSRNEETSAISVISGEGHQSSSPETDNQIFEDAQEWATKFKPPAVEDIKTPPRRSSRKRRVQKPPSEIRFKRLQAYYDNGYRELLNAEINDAAYGEPTNGPLEPSQIGSSIWAAEEKESLFSSLTRLGRDDIKGIAVQVGTKSEPQVQEYLRLLEANIVERKRKGARDSIVTELPAATEISEECCIVLERAGNSLAARQEMAEEKVEKNKWSDMWLIDERVSLLIEKRRREEGGEEALDAVLPAGNLFISKNWLELSNRIFMNPGTPHEEDNWEALAEPGETPAIRATAFEDFHSLAVDITKKLLSATLFCTMSRLRSGNYHYVKVSEITADDVEAAVNILGLNTNSDQFWLDCAKRNRLEVVDDGEAPEDTEPVAVTLDELRRELLSSRNSRSRSLSHYERHRSSSQTSIPEETADSSPSEAGLDDSEDFESELSVFEEEEQYTNIDSPDFTDPDSPTATATNRTTRIQDRKIAERDQDAYTEAFDMQASQKEEVRLWALIEQEPPFEIQAKSEKLGRPIGVRDDFDHERSWRDHLEYMSPWETIRTSVPDSAFEKNRHRKSRKAKARAKEPWLPPRDSVEGSALQEEEKEFEEGSEVDENQSQDLLEDVDEASEENLEGDG